MVDFIDGQPLKLDRLILRGGGFVEGAANTPIDANVFEMYAGELAQPISGDGAFYKRGEGKVQIDKAIPSFRGPITIEQGLLTLPESGLGWVEPTESTAIKVLAGGALSTRVCLINAC
jgi:hypothetical protein